MNERRKRISSRTVQTVQALGLAGAVTFLPSNQSADIWMLSAPEPLADPINRPDSTSLTPWLSADGLRMYFGSDRPGTLGSFDIWRAERKSADGKWEEPINLGPEVNTDTCDFMPFLSADELTMYFCDANPFNVGPRPDGFGNFDIWMTTRSSTNSSWQTPIPLPEPINSSAIECYPSLSADGLSLYFTSQRNKRNELHMASRSTPSGPWLEVTSFPNFNNRRYAGFPRLSSDNLRLVFYSPVAGGGFGGYDLWISTRSSLAPDWGEPVNLGPQINGNTFESSPWISADFPSFGATLHFARSDSKISHLGAKIYQARVIPRITLLEATSLQGPWSMLEDLAFKWVSKNELQSVVPTNAAVALKFYRLSIATPVRILRFEAPQLSAAGLEFRVRYAQ